MAKACSYPFCLEKKKKNEKSSVIFFSFPRKDENLKIEWETSLGFRVPTDPDPPVYVCSKHFLKSDFHGDAPSSSFGNTRTWTPRLKLTAVPQSFTQTSFGGTEEDDVVENSENISNIKDVPKPAAETNTGNEVTNNRKTYNPPL